MGLAENIVVIIAGPSGSGKSTVGKRLAKRHGLEYISGGEMFQKLFTQAYGLEKDTAHKVAFQDKREQNLAFDKKVDEELVKRAHQGNVVLDARMPAWLFKGKALRVWLNASTETLAERIAKRDSISFDKALELVRKKDKRDAELYQELYDFRPWPDPKVFDLILESDSLNEDEAFEALEKALGKFLQK